jgi:hypothetical protein
MRSLVHAGQNNFSHGVETTFQLKLDPKTKSGHLHNKCNTYTKWNDGM